MWCLSLFHQAFPKNCYNCLKDTCFSGHHHESEQPVTRCNEKPLIAGYIGEGARERYGV